MIPVLGQVIPVRGSGEICAGLERVLVIDTCCYPSPPTLVLHSPRGVHSWHLKSELGQKRDEKRKLQPVCLRTIVLLIDVQGDEWSSSAGGVFHVGSIHLRTGQA